MKKVIIFEATIFLSTFASTSIKKIGSLQEAFEEIQQTNRSTLVIFDIDNTLTEPVNKILQYRFRNTDVFKQFHMATHTLTAAHADPPAYKRLLESTRRLNVPVQLIEEQAPNVILAMQKRGSKIIALTFFETGSYGKIDRLEDLRFKQLQSVGIDFSSSFAQKTIILKNLFSDPQNNNYAMFYNGILLTGPTINSKGAVLGAFLDAIDWKPERVIFFDDCPVHLESVRREMEQRAIPFIGFEYSKAYEPTSEAIDPTLAAFEFEHLKKHHEFISDTQAQQILQAISCMQNYVCKNDASKYCSVTTHQRS